MSSDYPIFYQTLAEGMDEMASSVDSVLDAIEKAWELLIYLIDLQQNLDFDVNQAVVDIYGVMQEEVYKGLITLPKDEQKIWPGVLAVNTHTKKYITDDLTDFVNNDVWNGNCVPFEWARMSAVMGEDISGWNVCDSS